MPGVNYSINLDNAQFLGASSEASAAVESMGGSAAMTFAGIGGAVATATAGLDVLKSALAPIKDLFASALNESANRETIETGFVTLLGSAEKASERLKELSKFANDTPYELPGVAKASQTLEGFTKGTFSTGEALRLIGDAAAQANQPFEDVAYTVGRLYMALQNGQAMGEPAQRLQELNIMSAEARIKLEALQEAGEKGDKVWSVFTKDMDRFSGSMKRQSETLNGKKSNMIGAWGELLNAFGQPINDAIKPYLDKMTGFLGEALACARTVGEAIGNAIALMQEAWNADRLPALALQGLEIAFKGGINVLWAGLSGAASAFGQYLVEYAKGVVELFSLLAKKDFWIGLGEALLSIFVSVTAKLSEMLGNIINKIPGADKIGNAMIDNGKDGQQAAGMLMQNSSNSWREPMEELSKNMEKSAKEINDAFTAGYKNSSKLFNTDGIMSAFSDSIKFLQGKVDEKSQNREDQTVPQNQSSNPVAAVTEGLKKISFQMAGASSQAAVGGGGYGRLVMEEKEVSKQLLKEAKKTNANLEKISQSGYRPDVIFG